MTKLLEKVSAKKSKLTGQGKLSKENLKALEEASSYKPKTQLGKELWEIRKKIIAAGEPLLDWDGIEREIAKRRGRAE
jgi:Na+/citrate or Na+/malate symporter